MEQQIEEEETDHTRELLSLLPPPPFSGNQQDPVRQTAAPAKTFPNFRAANFVDRQILCCSETNIHKF